ncbi:MAG: YgiT-type zinc finger protein [Candidatus Competibacteraceae bacterium]|nr:MAG: YgiT-type zinc finger protein [Candidatus Competibacteraceae bacterium]
MRFDGGAMICEFCGGETQARKVKRSHWLQGRLYIVENVDAEVCQGCGERYFHATTLDAIDRHLSMEHEVKETMNVEVVDIAA